MFLIGFAFKSTVVLTGAWLITLLLRGRSAAVRHQVWTAASCAVLLLPLLSVSLPALRVPLSRPVIKAATFQISAIAQPLGAAGLSKPGTAGAKQTAGNTPIDWTLLAVSIWALGTLVALARLLLAWFAIARLRSGASPFGDGSFAGVEVLETAAGSMPMTFGIVRSAILLPADAADWTAELRRAVLLHELAHIRRGDVATHVLARLALSAYWWNPLAWLAWREFVKERERAADDLVLRAGTQASEYARHLLDVARGMQIAPATSWAAVAMVRRSQLETRVRAILDSDVNRNPTGRASAILTACVAVLLLAPLAAVRGQDVKVVAVPADVDTIIRAARSQKNSPMLEDSAKAAVEGRRFDAAEKLLEAAVAIRGEVSGNTSREYGLGLLKLAALQQRRHENDAAHATYAKAGQILGADPQAATALLHLGVSELLKKNYSQASDYLLRAQQIDAGSAGMALMWSAVLLEAQKNLDEADALFRRAVAQQDAKSADAATLAKVYSGFLRRQGREDEAAAVESRWPAPAANRAELPAGVYRIGGAVQPPKVLEKVEPEYSEEARAAKLTGTEILFVQIGTDGLAHNVQVVRGLGLGLDENGVDAISQWRFQPGQKDGQPVAVAATIEINFRLF